MNLKLVLQTSTKSTPTLAASGSIQNIKKQRIILPQAANLAYTLLACNPSNAQKQKITPKHHQRQHQKAFLFSGNPFAAQRPQLAGGSPE